MCKKISEIEKKRERRARFGASVSLVEIKKASRQNLPTLVANTKNMRQDVEKIEKERKREREIYVIIE